MWNAESLAPCPCDLLFCHWLCVLAWSADLKTYMEQTDEHCNPIT